MWNYLFSLQKEEWKGREKNSEHCFIFPLMWKSERKSGSEMFRSGSPVEQHYCMSQRCRLEQRHIHLLLLKDLKNGELLCLLSSKQKSQSFFPSPLTESSFLHRAAAWVSLWQCSLFIAANFKRSFSWSASYQDVAGNVCDTMLCAKLFPVRLFSCLVCQLSVLNYFCLVWWDFLSDLEGFVYYIYM